MAELKDPAMTVMAKEGTMNAMKNASRSSPVPKIAAIRSVKPSEASFTAALSPATVSAANEIRALMDGCCVVPASPPRMREIVFAVVRITMTRLGFYHTNGRDCRRPSARSSQSPVDET